MPTKFNDIICLRGGKAAYNIDDEKANEWLTFTPNDQFNSVLQTVLNAVRGNNIDNHKSFWIYGTYGTGKSHASAVITHLLCDESEAVQQWVEQEYAGPTYDAIRANILTLKGKKRLLPVKLYGLQSMSNPNDLALVIQRQVSAALKRAKLTFQVSTNFQLYAQHVEQQPTLWDTIIAEDMDLSSVVSDRKQLVGKLDSYDIDIYHYVSNALRSKGIDIRLDNNHLKQWILEVQRELRHEGTYNGMLLVWDEFTDVMAHAIGLQVLKALQEIAESLMNMDNDTFLLLISHPSAFNKLYDTEVMKQTDGRYHRMQYNMESVSAFKIMSRKFQIIDQAEHTQRCSAFYNRCPSDMLEKFTQHSNSPQTTAKELCMLFPLHPGTANLATHYATVVGSSSRSVFEFLGQNGAINAFLESSTAFEQNHTITADYLWDYVLPSLQQDITNYGSVTERFNSHHINVTAKGEAYAAIFKGVLLLNAFNNISGDNNKGLITPSTANIHLLFDGSQYAQVVDEVLAWLDEQGVVQRAPDGLYSVQFSALPAGEIAKQKERMYKAEFNQTQKILAFASSVVLPFLNQPFKQIKRPYELACYADVGNDTSLRSQIKHGRGDVKSSSYFFALFFARSNEELARLHSFAQNCSANPTESELKDTIIVVFDTVLEENQYHRFIEYQANAACASTHGFLDQRSTHEAHAREIVMEWIKMAMRNYVAIYLPNGVHQSIDAKKISSFVNSSVTPIIFPYGADAHELLRQKAPNTFWEVKNSKEIVRSFLNATTRSELENLGAQMGAIKFLVQDCLDENLNWKTDMPDAHPMKMVYDKVQQIISHADKSLPFNFEEKFKRFTSPPYGLYSCFAAMAMFAFAMRNYKKKLFDMQGKLRSDDAMVSDIVELFKAWDKDKKSNKLLFKFQTPEEGKLCKELIELFGLGGERSSYKDVSSLKDARYAIVSDFLQKKDAPLWVLKYLPDEETHFIPTDAMEAIKKLIDHIVVICNNKELRNPSLVNETIQLINKYRFEMRNLLLKANVFSRGFAAYLLQIDIIKLQAHEVEQLITYLKQNLSASIGYWSETEVTEKAKEWRILQQRKEPVPHPLPTPNPTPITNGEKDVDADLLQAEAEQVVNSLTSVDTAKEMLLRLCRTGDAMVWNLILNK